MWRLKKKLSQDGGYPENESNEEYVKDFFLAEGRRVSSRLVFSKIKVTVYIAIAVS